ncbi:hypothetical protein Sjap_003459 [Stephania japonica]|uniref:Receptor-like serine/threonine-protein kinase n=1 Tax=Stephania japonica TaxID=461633 RepID=A0AAP0PVH0_9MAGN
MLVMDALFSLAFFAAILCFLRTSKAGDTITPSQPLIDGQTIASEQGMYELGFFTPPTSQFRYLGIWYKKISSGRIVWVANRASPFIDKHGMLKLTKEGKLILLNQTDDQTIIWSSNSSKTTQNQVSAQLLDTGNLVVKDNKNNNDDYLWQSFDYPCHVMLSGMKLGRNFRTGQNWYISSWKSISDPSPGIFAYGIDTQGVPQPMLRKGSDVVYRTGSWNGVQFSGTPYLVQNPFFEYNFISNEDEVYFSYKLRNQSVVVDFLILSQYGLLLSYSWNDRIHDWDVYDTGPLDVCQGYNVCGAYGVCNVEIPQKCECLHGFVHESWREWNSGGCSRRTQFRCGEKEGFQRIAGVKLPDTRNGKLNMSMSMAECEAECLKNCSCTAYAIADVSKNNGCLLWMGQLMDVRSLMGHGQDLYLKMAASELDPTRSSSLDWRRRYAIICGIARGLLYLHQDSRLRIIHRDLKLSNILLDNEMNPKISDFGLARSFRGDQVEANTRRVVGTYGYMSPEYAIDGLFSVKSDIFSFGVIVLEIVSGKKNRGFNHPGHSLNLLGHAWKLWKEGNSVELLDITNRIISALIDLNHCSSSFSKGFSKSGTTELFQHEGTGSHQNSAVKRAWPRVVLGWVTSWEVLDSSVVPDSLNLCTYPSGRRFESRGRKTDLAEPDGVGGVMAPWLTSCCAERGCAP